MKNIDLDSIMKTEEFARLHAHISGDGYTQHSVTRRSEKELLEHRRKNLYRNRYVVRYVNMEPDLVKAFIKDVESLFNRKVIKLRKFEYEVCGKWVYNIFVQSGALKSGTWYIPEEIMNGELKIKKQWIKAFFDDEGFIAKERNTLGLTTVNRFGMEQIRALLLDFGITCKVNGPYYPKNPKHQMFYMIRLNGKFAELFCRQIGSNHPVKMKRMEELIKKMKWGRRDNHLPST